MWQASGCKKTVAEVPPNMTESREVPHSDAVLDGPSGGEMPNTNRFLAEVPAGSLGPRLVSSEAGDVAIWAVVAGEASGLYASHARPGEKPVARRVADVDPTLKHLTVGLSKDAQVLAVGVHTSGGQEVLTVTRLGPLAAYQSGPSVLATTPSSIIYTKVVPTALGAVVTWVERAQGAADLYTVLVDEKGPRRPVRLIRGITAWQVAATNGSLTIATREGFEEPTLRLHQLGDRGEVIGSPIEIARNVVGGKDLDLAVGKDRILVAYSDEGPHEARLMGTLLDRSGNVLHAGFPLTKPRGEQALLSVKAATTGGFVVAWHEPRHAYHGSPSVLLGRLSPDALPVEPTWALGAARRDALLPIFATYRGGTSALIDYGCSPSECASSTGRMVLSLPDKGPPRGKQLKISVDEHAALAWDLTCHNSTCRYLLSDGGTPAHVYLGAVDASSAPPEGLVQHAPKNGPGIESHDTLGEIPELAELTGVTWAEGARSLLAWVSYFEPDLPYVIPEEPAPDGRRAPVRARLTTVQPAGDGGGPRAESVISYRARSLGGVHLVAPEENRGLLVWSALDQKVPQLFATVIDAEGKKVSQKMLTRSDAEVSDVAATRVPGGYLIAWVEGEGSAAKLMTLRVNDRLVPSGNPHVVTPNAISPSGASLLTSERGVVCVWSDARASGSTGAADLYSIELDPQTAAPQGVERRLTSSDAHAHSPRLVTKEGGQIAIGWISDTLGRGRSELRIATLEPEGRLTAAQIWDTEGDVRDFSFECRNAECRAVAVVVLDHDSAPRTSLWALKIPDGDAPRGAALLPLWAPGAEGVSPTLLGDEVYFADAGADDAGWRLRRAKIRW